MTLLNIAIALGAASVVAAIVMIVALREVGRRIDRHFGQIKNEDTNQ